MDSQTLPVSPSLSRWEWYGLGALAVLALAFGLYVEVRSAFLSVRRTDLNVYLRAAWAVRAGESPYEFITVGDCHYNYPPLLAILLSPLADKPLGVAGPATVPFPLTVALWYTISLLAALWGVHALASALECRSAARAAHRHAHCSRGWWALRVYPLLVCLPGIARTLSLGQVDLLVLGLLCAMVAAVVEGKSGRAGLWLAGAICIKFIPAFLLVYPLWRRDGRCLAGCALGVAVGWALIPAIYCGPARAWDNQRRWAEVVALPGAGLGQDQSRETDLTQMTSVNSQSLVAVLHNLLYPIRELRPAHAALPTKALALLISALLLVLVLAAAKRRAATGATEAITLGALLAVMLLSVPVCHPHYFCHWVPLVTGLLAWELERRGGHGLGWRLVLLLVLNGVGNALTSVPGLEGLRDQGAATGAGVLLWAAALVALYRRGADPQAARAECDMVSSPAIPSAVLLPAFLATASAKGPEGAGRVA